MSDDWRFPTHISTEEWQAMSITERTRLNDKAWTERRDGIIRAVREEHPDWEEIQIDEEVVFRLYPNDIDRETCRKFAEYVDTHRRKQQGP